MVRLLKANGVKPIIVTFVYNNNKDQVFTPSNNQFYNWAMQQQNKKLKKIASEENIGCYDLAQYFPWEDKYFADSIHMTAEGNALRAKLIADYLQNNKLITQ